MGALGASMVACSDADPDAEAPAESGGESTSDLELSQDGDRFTVEYTFEGGWTPEGGLWVGELTRTPSPRITSASGLVSVAQADYCEQDAENDGVAGSNPPNTFELVTDSATYASFGPFEWTPGAGCDAPGHTPTPDTSNYAPNGVTCAEVTLRSFYSIPFANVHAEIREFSGTAGHYGFVFPEGTSAPDPDGPGGVLAQYGLWAYGDMDAAGGANDASTVQWTFQNSDTTPFDFRGRVVAEITEICGNFIDDDCDAIIDEGCGSFPQMAGCENDIDCASGFCDAGGRCGAPTCPNGAIDGSESDVDCGGPGCPDCTVGQVCNLGTDCDTGVCNDTSATESLCRTYRNPGAGELVITEFFANTPGDDSVNNYVGEWFELYNPTASTLSLEGCRLYDDGGDSELLYGDEFVIGAGEYHVFARGPVPSWLSAAVPAAQLHATNAFVLGNGGDEIRIECGSTQIDAYTYDDGDIDQTAEGVAFQLHAPIVATGTAAAVANDDRSEFCAGTDVYANDGAVDVYGTPGAANASCPEFAPSFCRFQSPTARPSQAGGGLTLAVFGRVYAAGYTDLTAGFNDPQPSRFVAQVGYGAVGADPTAAGQFTWTDMAPNAGYDCSSCGNPEDNNDEYTVDLAVPNTVGTTYDLAMRFSGDNGATWTVCDTGAGSADGYASVDAAQLEVITPPPTPTTRGDLIFTELFINLPGGTEDGEFYELYNTTTENLELQGCVIDDQDGNPFTIGTSYVLAAGDYVVIGAPGATAYADLIDPFLSLSNSGDPFSITCGGTLIDEFVYTTDLDNSGYTQQLDPSAYDADLNDVDVTFNSRNIKAWWCDTPRTAANVYGQWLDDGSATLVDVYGTPGAANDSCLAIDYCRIDNPRVLADVASGSTHTIEGQLYSEGATDQGVGNVQHHMLRAEFGHGTDGSTDPGTDFSWTAATPIPGWDGSAVGEPNNDGYEATLTAPASAGAAEDFAFRFSGDNGTTWTYCDGVVGGSDATVDGYQAANAGQINTAPNWTIGSCFLNWPTGTIDQSLCGRGGDVAAGDACNVYGTVYVVGLTDATGNVDTSANLVLEVGYGVSGTPSNTWTSWTSTVGTIDDGSGVDQYVGAITVPTADAPGPNYDYGVRASGDGGATWTYCTGTGDMDVVAYDAEWGQFQSGTSFPSATEGETLALGAQSWHGFTVTWGYGPVFPVPTDVVGQAGYAATGAADPCADDSAWTFTNATATGTSGNNYTWTASVTAPAAGTYDTLWRFSGDGGATWLCVDTAGIGSSNRGVITTTAMQPGDIVITEIMQNPSSVGDASGEWIELYNATASALDLEGMVISDDGSDTFTITGSLPIAAGEYLVLANTGAALDGVGTPDYVYGTSWFLSNSDDEVVLTMNGTEIDRVNYDNGATFPDPSGASMQLIATSLDNAVGTNWCEASVGQWAGADFGTPGAANDCDTSLAAGSLIITEIMYDSNHGTGDEEWVELYNTTGGDIDLAVFGPLSLSDNGANTVSFTTGVIPANSYVVFGSDLITEFTPDFTYVQGNMTLGNGGDGVFVVLGGIAQDNVDYSAASFHDPSGASLNLDVDLYASDRTNGDNWCSGLTTYGVAGNLGTPGAANNACTELCTGGTDEDADGETDCADAACAADAACSGPPPSDCLIISEYIEGAAADGNSKAIELYNCGTTTFDFSSGDYRVCLETNANSGCNGGFAIDPVTLAPGAIHTICGSETTPLTGLCDQVNGSWSNNGDDRTAVYLNVGGGTEWNAADGDVLFDALGEFGLGDPGSPWANSVMRRIDCTPYDGASSTINAGPGNAGFDAMWSSTALPLDASDFGVAPTCP